MRQYRLVVVGVSLLIGLTSMAGVAVAGSDEDLAAINKIREMEADSLNNAAPGSIG